MELHLSGMNIVVFVVEKPAAAERPTGTLAVIHPLQRLRWLDCRPQHTFSVRYSVEGITRGEAMVNDPIGRPQTQTTANAFLPPWPMVEPSLVFGFAPKLFNSRTQVLLVAITTCIGIDTFTFLLFSPCLSRCLI